MHILNTFSIDITVLQKYSMSYNPMVSMINDDTAGVDDLTHIRSSRRFDEFCKLLLIVIVDHKRSFNVGTGIECQCGHGN